MQLTVRDNLSASQIQSLSNATSLRKPVVEAPRIHGFDHYELASVPGCSVQSLLTAGFAAVLTDLDTSGVAVTLHNLPELLKLPKLQSLAVTAHTTVSSKQQKSERMSRARAASPLSRCKAHCADG